MLDALYMLLSTPAYIGWIILAVPIGLIFGVIPGLGGKIAIISAMPFVFGMDMVAGAIFLISLHAVVHTGGALPAIFFGVPGTGPSTAIVADGHAMARKGMAMRALSASVIASMIGGVIGGFVLAAFVPVALELLQMLSYPEIFLLAIFGITLSAILSQGSLLKGLAAGCFGLTLAFIGHDQVFGVERLTFDQPFLWDGVSLVVMVLAIFAVPEMLDLDRRRQVTIPMPAPADKPLERCQSSGWWQGWLDIVAHRWLVFRCSVLGTVVGVIPGLGGDVAAWLCYAHAAQSSKTPEKFGKGEVCGVIGPEAANNAKEGGALVPTLFLGIPGSSGMAILLVALVPLGIVPGPGFASEVPEVAWAMVWALILSNIVAAAVIWLVCHFPLRLGRISGAAYVPYVYLFSLLSIYMASYEWRFILLFLALALVGVGMRRFGWPRAPFVIGAVLGPVAEDALVKSLSIWGEWFFFRPVSLILMAALIWSLVRLAKHLRRSRTVMAKREQEALNKDSASGSI